jgi:hypothetical protein
VLAVMMALVTLTFAMFSRAWRLPCQPRLVPITGRRRSRRAALTIELAVILIGCLAISFFGAGLMLLVILATGRV